MKKPKLIYVAGPYTKPDPCVNTHTAIGVGEAVWATGMVPFVPHLTHFWHTVSPHPYQDWLDYDMHWLRVCDAVLRFPGESSGADKEVAEANRLGIPVFHTVDEVVAWAEGDKRDLPCGPSDVCDMDGVCENHSRTPDHPAGV